MNLNTGCLITFISKCTSLINFDQGNKANTNVSTNIITNTITNDRCVDFIIQVCHHMDTRNETLHATIGNNRLI